MSKIQTLEELKLQDIEEIITTGGKRQIVANTWSATLENSCLLCASLDGKSIAANDPIFHTFQPPLHPNCRCLWVSHTNLDPYPPVINWKSPSEEMIKDYGMNIGIKEKEIENINQEILPIADLMLLIPVEKRIIKNKIEPLE